jgi:hypothetical protein
VLWIQNNRQKMRGGLYPPAFSSGCQTRLPFFAATKEGYPNDY